MNSFTLFLVTANKPLFPFFTFTIEQTRGILMEAFCWNHHRLTPLTDSNLCKSFVKWCESITDEAHHVVCVPTSAFVSLANKYLPWTSSVKALSDQVRLLCKEVPQIAKIHSFLFLMDFLPVQGTESTTSRRYKRKTYDNTVEDRSLQKKLKDLSLYR